MRGSTYLETLWLTVRAHWACWLEHWLTDWLTDDGRTDWHDMTRRDTKKTWDTDRHTMKRRHDDDEDGRRKTLTLCSLGACGNDGPGVVNEWWTSSERVGKRNVSPKFEATHAVCNRPNCLLLYGLKVDAFVPLLDVRSYSWSTCRFWFATVADACDGEVLTGCSAQVQGCYVLDLDSKKQADVTPAITQNVKQYCGRIIWRSWIVRTNAELG